MKFKNIVIIVLLIGSLLALKFIFFPSEASKGDNKQGGKAPMPSNVAAYIIKA